MNSETTVFFTLYHIMDGTPNFIDSSESLERIQKFIKQNPTLEYQITKTTQVNTTVEHSNYTPENGLKECPVVDYAGFGDD